MFRNVRCKKQMFAPEDDSLTIIFAPPRKFLGEATINLHVCTYLKMMACGEARMMVTNQAPTTITLRERDDFQGELNKFVRI